MMNYIAQHKLLALLVLVLLIGAAWWAFTNSASPAPVLSTTAGPAGASSTQDDQIVETLLQLQAVSLSGTILSDPGFLALQDYTTQIVQEPIGRPNPFAPVSSGVPASSSTVPINPNIFAPAKQ